MKEPAQRGRPTGRACSVLGMRVDEVDYDSVGALIRRWVQDRSSRYVCVSNVHMVMESYDDPGFRAVVNQADLVGADGVPVIRVSRWLGLARQSRVFAPDLVLKLCRMAAEEGIPVGFYGSTPDIIEAIVGNIGRVFPRLNVTFQFSPPFRPLTPEEVEATVRDINNSGVRILFVGLGCPKQERWMNQMRDRVEAVMLGVGWAFDVIAGESRTAPGWIQSIGMEWLYRLVLNPKKLWRRHLRNNPRFIVLIILQLLGFRRYPLDAEAPVR